MQCIAKNEKKTEIITISAEFFYSVFAFHSMCDPSKQN